MTESRYPLGEDGYPAPNYVMVPDGSRPHFRRASAVQSSDVPKILVIGAGYTGLAAALRLAELRSSEGRPARILLLERDHVAAGPSGKNAGHICGLQLPDAAVRRRCGRVLGDRLIEAADAASHLVRRLIERHAIACDVRDGYVSIASNGQQTVTTGGLAFGIDPYPFALGLAFAAERMGVEIYEGTEVSGLNPSRLGCVATVAGNSLSVAGVLASGGHRIAEVIELLAPLRQRTTEVLVSTIITDPLPDALLRQIMPEADNRRFPFANEAANVAYGSIDRSNRVMFGAHASALSTPDPERIASTLAALFPGLFPGFRALTGRNLAWRPLVEVETLSFTRDLLPVVGTVTGCSNILYVQALGGHGIALGTLLGTVAAEKLWALLGGRVSGDAQIFDAFAAVSHGWMPTWQPWRALTTEIGRMLR
jgi:gamma-glutamylputrescine oxidase